MTMTKTPPFRLPEDNFLPFKDISRNKQLVPGAGLSVEIIGKTPSHLSFRINKIFAGGCIEPLFEYVSAEIGKWWPNSDQISEINHEILDGNLDRITTLQEFVTERLNITVDLDTEEGEAIFRLKFEVEPSAGKSCVVHRSSKISLRRLESWIGDIE
jgi:hypothetical protein